MADLETLGITVNDARKKVNPSLDVNGIQLGNHLFSLTAQDSSVVRINIRQLNLNVGLGKLAVGQLEGYRIYLNSNFAVPYIILTNAETDDDDITRITVEQDLPIPNGNWDILCKHTRVSLSTEQTELEIRNGVRDAMNKLRPDYQKMLKRLTGFMLWPRDFIGNTGNAVTNNAFQLPFYKATDVRVWLGPFYGYSYRHDDSKKLISGSDYNITHDDVLKTSTLILTQLPEENRPIAVDFVHTLDPVPQTLIDVALSIIEVRLMVRATAGVMSEQTFELLKMMREDADKILENGIYEFDSIELYDETKVKKSHGTGSIELHRK